MEKTKLNFINKEWIESNNLPDPTVLIQQYKSQLEKAFEKTEVEQDISPTKLEQVKESSITVIHEAIKNYNSINNNTIVEEPYNNWFIHGERIVMEKNAFSDNNDTHHLNFDSFLASHIAKKFKHGISETFLYTNSGKYLLNAQDVFKGIDRLKIKGSDYVIVSFGNNLPYIKDQYSIDELSENKYKDFEIISFQESNHLVAGESLFIVKKIDLPNIICRELDTEQIKKYSLELVNEEIKLYVSVINLNKNQELRNELSSSHQDKDLNKSVLLNLSLLTEIRWKKNIQNIMIQINSPFSEKGIPNNLKDVKEVKE